MAATEFITDREIYERVILDAVPRAEEFLWIATADIKDLYVAGGGRMRPFLEVLSNLIEDGVLVRLVHAKEPGPAFREDFDRYPNLIEGLDRLLCPRVHFKSVIVDGEFAYTRKAITGAISKRASSPPTRTWLPGSCGNSTNSGWGCIAPNVSAKSSAPNATSCSEFRGHNTQFIS